MEEEVRMVVVDEFWISWVMNKDQGLCCLTASSPHAQSPPGICCCSKCCGMFWWYLWWPVCKWGSRHWPSSWASAHMNSRDTCVHRSKLLCLPRSHSRWCIHLPRALRWMGRWVTQASCLESWDLCLQHKKKPWSLLLLTSQGNFWPAATEGGASRNACSRTRVPSCDLLSYSPSPGSHAKAQGSRKATSTGVCCSWGESQEITVPMQQGFGKLHTPPSMPWDCAGVWSFKSAAEQPTLFYCMCIYLNICTSLAL